MPSTCMRRLHYGSLLQKHSTHTFYAKQLHPDLSTRSGSGNSCSKDAFIWLISLVWRPVLRGKDGGNQQGITDRVKRQGVNPNLPKNQSQRGIIGSFYRIISIQSSIFSYGDGTNISSSSPNPQESLISVRGFSVMVSYLQLCIFF